MTRLILSTGNIIAGGPSIIRRNGGEKSNLELVNALRASFKHAQQDYSPPPSASATPSEDGRTTIKNQVRPPPGIWTTRENGDLYIPTMDASMAGLLEEREQYDITVKLFFLPGAGVSEREQCTKDALALVMKELRVDNVNLLVVSFPGLSFESDCEYEADRINSAQGNDEEELATWPIMEDLYRSGIVKRLGLAEFGSEKLARFLEKVQVRPEVDQINVKNCCSVPPPLIELSKKEKIELLTHSDTNEILPSGTLRELLGTGPRGAGVVSEMKHSVDGSKSEIIPKWVAKYTAIVQNRGVIENKGYFAGAELTE